MEKNQKLLLIDSSALIYRAYYALPPLTDRKGRVVNAVYGFMSAFINILKQTNPTHVIFAFDSPKPTLRKEKYVDYKAHREKAPDDLYAQIPISKDLVKNLSFTELEVPGFEADDIIATCATSFLKGIKGREVVIATGDLDTLQLINPHIKVFVLSRGVAEAKLYDEEAVRERFGLEPKQMNDFKALFGDASDNIKGVKGIGKKTAAELLQKYNTLEGIYENINLLKPRIRELLTQEKDQAFLSRELVILEKEVPFECNLDNTKISLEEMSNKKGYLEELSFNSLAKRVGELTKISQQPARLDSRSDGSAVSSQQFLDKKVTSYKLQVTKDIQYLNNQVDLEKNLIPQLDKYQKALLWFGKTEKGNRLLVAPCKDSNISEVFLLPIEIAKKLEKSIFKDKKIYFFDFKETYKNSLPLDFSVENVVDLKLKAYLIQPPLIRKFGFKEIAWHFLKERWEEPKKQLNLLMEQDNGYNNEKIIELLGLLAKLSTEIDSVFEEQAKFQKQSHKDSYFVSAIFPEISNRIEHKSIDFIYNEVEMPLSKVLGKMELAGIKIDLELLNKLRGENARNIENLKKNIFDACGKEFNLDSPSQLADILFEYLKISPTDSKRGKAGHYSTAANVLEKLADKHPVVSSLLNYREQRKFQTTYLEVIPKLINKETQKLHTIFEQTGAATGRLSSNNPNLQNIPLQPIDKIKNIGLRDTFIAEDGFKFVSLDYSQIEIRLAAYLSGEEKLIRAFERGEDVHRQTAAFVNNITSEEVTENMRSAAKALNFGIIYGMSPFGFSQSSKLSESESRIFIESYFREFRKIAQYIQDVKAFSKDHGFVETVFGRRRYIPEATSPNRMLRQAGERMAVNMPLQGTAADIMKLALVKTSEFLEKKYADPKAHPLKRDARILLSIHDEIILEVRNSLVEKVAGEVKEIMENVAKEILPLKVDVEIGENWGEI